MYSHLSNKRGGTLIDFEKKIHPPRTFPPSTFMDFLNFFHPPLHVYCIYVLVFSKKSHPPRLFQPPRLLILQLSHPLHVYSNLHGYQSTLLTAEIIKWQKCAHGTQWISHKMYNRIIEKMKILGALLELPAKQHCQSSPFTSKLGQIGQIGSAVQLVAPKGLPGF